MSVARDRWMTATCRSRSLAPCPDVTLEIRCPFRAHAPAKLLDATLPLPIACLRLFESSCLGHFGAPCLDGACLLRSRRCACRQRWRVARPFICLSEPEP
eukprot:6209096-Pleurochrysis_carterae.AAC.4